MKRRDPPGEDPRLFDLPDDLEPKEPSLSRSRKPDLGDSLPLFPSEGEAGDELAWTEEPGGGELPDIDDLVEDPSPGAVASDEAYSEEAYPEEEYPDEAYPEDDWERQLGFRDRLLAGLADLVVQGGAVALAALGQVSLGVPLERGHWPAYLTFLVAFSFLYTVIPLAFWGQTPGMSLKGLTVRSEEGENPSFPQTILRWLAGVITCCLAGLPLLVAISGRSLGDLWSRSHTRLGP